MQSPRAQQSPPDRLYGESLILLEVFGEGKLQWCVPSFAPLHMHTVSLAAAPLEGNGSAFMLCPPSVYPGSPGEGNEPTSGLNSKRRRLKSNSRNPIVTVPKPKSVTTVQRWLGEIEIKSKINWSDTNFTDLQSTTTYIFMEFNHIECWQMFLIQTAIER